LPPTKKNTSRVSCAASPSHAMRRHPQPPPRSPTPKRNPPDTRPGSPGSPRASGCRGKSRSSTRATPSSSGTTWASSRGATSCPRAPTTSASASTDCSTSLPRRSRSCAACAFPAARSRPRNWRRSPIARKATAAVMPTSRRAPTCRSAKSPRAACRRCCRACTTRASCRAARAPARPATAPATPRRAATRARAMHHHILMNRELYGLPRKFNIAFDGGNAIAALEDTNDIGFRAVKVEAADATPDVPAGVYFRVALGGITGHRDFARDCGLLVAPEECVAVADAMVRVFIAHGDRGNRNKARLKYVLDAKGFDWFVAETGKVLGAPLRRFPLAACRFAPASDRLAHLGIHAQKQDGLCWVGAHVPAGRMTAAQMRGVARLARRNAAPETTGDARHTRHSIRLTVWQNFLVAGVP